jgi:hypothetical protein
LAAITCTARRHAAKCQNERLFFPDGNQHKFNTKYRREYCIKSLAVQAVKFKIQTHKCIKYIELSSLKSVRIAQSYSKSLPAHHSALINGRFSRCRLGRSMILKQRMHECWYFASSNKAAISIGYVEAVFISSVQ